MDRQKPGYPTRPTARHLTPSSLVPFIASQPFRGDAHVVNVQPVQFATVVSAALLCSARGLDNRAYTPPTPGHPWKKSGAGIDLVCQDGLTNNTRLAAGSIRVRLLRVAGFEFGQLTIVREELVNDFGSQKDRSGRPTGVSFSQPERFQDPNVGSQLPAPKMTVVTSCDNPIWVKPMSCSTIRTLAPLFVVSDALLPGANKHTPADGVSAPTLRHAHLFFIFAMVM
ncbi:hypothetical protein AK812_SmicGene25571 [Symbiodinium microadriaticum]|uniref:Uncharacterized protein n=1 Tax=Symbiodinium microadriaticum TaxID=2951 RepID=A0A1Q9DBS9_SYMMI|nr:hypothetical protein AK812_SmicGene25571 [Symbiodinium microadriaticum]CAE7219382.1 unnamed protein product [Symbiodinium microadriaticum]